MIYIPENPKIYHITHIKNLEGIKSDGIIWSDAERIKHGLECEIVGMPKIKRRRLEELKVTCHSGTMVGEYVPFNFCSRSIMLYILYKGNHPEISYHGGQTPILHLQADLKTTIQWAEDNEIYWAFTDRNAGERIAFFYKDIRKLDKINWRAVESLDFREMLIRGNKQAEFLLYESFPLHLVEKIGVFNDSIKEQVVQILGNRSTLVSVEKSWYY